MKRTWTIIGVTDVPASFKWYQALLGLPTTTPAHHYFGQILDSDGTGYPRASFLDEPRLRQTWKRPPLVLSC
jgi:catechol 2,3-dioxygenase-like lactoylglutathione lyase family enzyme